MQHVWLRRECMGGCDVSACSAEKYVPPRSAALNAARKLCVAVPAKCVVAVGRVDVLADVHAYNCDDELAVEARAALEFR